MPPCSEKPAYCATAFVGPSSRAGTVCKENTFCPARGPTATRYVIEWPIRIIERTASVGGELEITAFGIARQDALAFEGAADAFGHALHERLQLLLTWGLNSPEHRRLGTDEIRAVEHEHVEVNIEIERRAEALDHRHGARRAARASEPCFLENVSRGHAVHDAEHLRERFGVSCKQEPQRERQREHPLTQRLLRERFVRQQCRCPSSAALRRRGKSPGVCN